MFASATSFAPRFIEFWGETNTVVTEYIKKKVTLDE